MNTIKKLCLIPLMAFLPIFVFAQKKSKPECVQKLKEAEKRYSAGKTDNLYNDLKDCLLHGLSRDDQVEGYRFLVMAAVFSDSVVLAEQYMAKLLSVKPDFVLNEAIEPQEFINIYKRFRTYPLFSIGISFGPNLTNGLIFNHYTTDLQEDFGTYRPRLAMFVQPKFYYSLTKHVQVYTGIGWVSKRFAYEEDLFDYSTLSYTEVQNYLSIPLGALLQTGGKDFRFYLGTQINAMYMLSASANATRVDYSIAAPDVTGPTIKGIDKQRSTYNWEVQNEIGARIKFNTGYLQFGAFHSYGLNNIAKPSERYSNNELVYRYGYVDNDFILYNFGLTLGYHQSFYKPVKLKRLDK